MTNSSVRLGSVALSELARVHEMDAEELHKRLTAAGIPCSKATITGVLRVPVYYSAAVRAVAHDEDFCRKCFGSGRRDLSDEYGRRIEDCDCTKGAT